MRVVDPFHAVFHQRIDLIRCDGAATASEYFYMRCAEFAQAVDHVTEKLVMSALVGTDCDAVGVLLDRRPDDIVDAAVMAEVNHLHALCLNQSSHDIDGGIVTVEQ